MIADLYDFDKTLYPRDSAIDFWLFCIKKNPRILKFLPKQMFAVIELVFKKIKLSQFKEKFFCFVSAIDAPAMAQRFWDENQSSIYPWFNPKENDVKTVVCSASPEFQITPILKKLGVDLIIGSVVDEKSGKFLSENCKGEEKVRRIKQAAPELEFRNAYTDNLKSDAPLLSLAENKFLVKKGKIIAID